MKLKYNKISALLLAAALLAGTAGCAQQPAEGAGSPAPSAPVSQSVQPSASAQPEEEYAR